MKRNFQNSIFAGVFAVASLLGLSAFAEEAQSNASTGYEKTGESVDCLRHRQVRDSDPLDDYNILFEASGGRLFLNTLNGRCTGLARDGRFSYRTPQAQVCKGDIITVTDTFGNTRGSCSLGAFEEVTKPAPPDALAQ